MPTTFYNLVKPSRWVFLSLFFFGYLSPLVALEELSRIDPLAPMDGPGERPVGWQWHYIDHNGKPGFMQKVAHEGGHASYTRSDGCAWTRPVKGFAPAIKWSNCPSSGTATVEFEMGDIWPLEVGNRFTWSYRGSSNLIGKAWKSKRSCEVKPSLRIRTVLGEFDVHKLDCQERWGSRTWWLSPEIGTAIAYRQKTRNGTLLQEMVRIVEVH